MPNNGLVFSAKALVFSVSSSCSASGSGDGDLTKGHSGQLVTGYAPDSVNVVPGITLNVSSSFDGTSGTWSASYNGPGGTYSAGGAAFMTPVKIEARMKGVKLYCKLTGSLWRLTWTGIDLYVNGSIVQTDWGGSGDELSDGTGPNYVPIIGLPGSPSGSVSAGRANVPAFVYDPCDPSSTAAIAWTASATNTLVGGWQIQEADDSLTALSLRPYSHSAPSGTGCPYGLNLDGIVTADSTLATVTITTASTYQHEYVGREAETVTVTRYCLDARGERILATAYSADGPARCIDPCTGVLADGYRDVYKTTTTGSGQNGTVVTLPNLEKAIVRLEPDYRAMWLRASVFPSVTASVSRSCVDGAVTSDNSSTPTVYAEENVLLSVVGDSTHAIEDVFGVPTYAPCTATRSQSESVVFDMRQPSTCLEPPDWFDPPACADPEFGFETDQVTHWPASHDNHAKSESVGLTFPSAVGSGGGYQSHNNALARYCASWGAPHWHFGYFPGRYTVEGEVQNGYYVDGTFAPWASYGGKIGEQWLYDSSLPTGEKRRTRNSIVASPLEDDNGNTPFLDTYFGGLRWIGVSRFAVDETTVPSSWTATQSVHGSWNATGASLSFGASYISVGSFTEPQAVVDFALGSLSVKPYELLRLAKQVVVGWESGNVSAVKVVLVGLDGSETTLGTSGGTYDVVAGKSRKYAGSWGIQNGTGGVDDEGTDTGGRGISAASMSDPDRATAFQLSTGRDYRTLRFYVTPVSTSSSVSLHYPTVNLWRRTR